MTISELKQVIYETVKKAVREEVRDILLESVKQDKPDEYIVTCQQGKPSSTTTTTIGSLLQETLGSMTFADYKNIYPESGKVYPSFSKTDNQDSDLGDLPSFAKNAKAVLDAANEIDRSRNLQ